MLYFPPAKINIGLRILRKRPDAYHDLELSFFEVPSLCDILEIVPDTEDRFFCEGRDIPGAEKDNLVLKARDLIDKNSKGKRPPCCIHLLKKIPTGSGLGGGSADATYTLIGLNRTLSLGFSDLEIRNMASSLGSDCAFFTMRTPCIGHEKGDRLEPLHTGHNRNFHLCIIVPALSISTAMAYGNCIPNPDRLPLKALLSNDISCWKSSVENDFEKTLFPLFPELARIKQALYEAGAVYASLSGSGSALFGLFSEKPEPNALYIPPNSLIRQTNIVIP